MSSITPAFTSNSSSGVPILNAEMFTLNGVSWQALVPDNDGTIPYSLAVKGTKYRFEVKDGQNYQTMAFSDPAYVLRSEVYGPTFPFNANVTFAFDLLVRSQNPQPTTNAWMIFGQIHADNNIGASPPCSFNVQPDPGGPTGEKLVFNVNYQTSGGPVVFTNAGSISFSRNRLYQVQWVFRDAQGQATGYWQITIDGVVVATYNGVTGYATAVTGSYPKWGIYSGGNGAVVTDVPLSGQDIVAEYDNVTFTSLVPAFVVSSSGSDSNAGTLAAPFLTVNKAITAMNASGTIKTTYVRSGTVNTNTMAFGAGQSLLPYPGDPAFSATVHITNPETGPSAIGVTIKGLVFTMTGSGGMIKPPDGCTNLKIQGNRATCVGYQNFLQVFNPGDGLRIQGNAITSDTWYAPGAPTNQGGLFPINIICNTNVNHNDWIVNSNTINGGTFPIQAQHDIAGPRWTNIHFDWNICTGFGDAASTIGNIGMSIVGAYSNSNANNTCTGNQLTGRTGIGTTLGFECLTAGCTYAQNTIHTTNGFALANCVNSLFNGNTLTVSNFVFSNDGIGTNPDVYTSATAATVEVRTNTINGTSRSGIWTPTNLSPAPSATGLPTNPPSTPYAG